MEGAVWRRESAKPRVTRQADTMAARGPYIILHHLRELSDARVHVRDLCPHEP